MYSHISWRVFKLLQLLHILVAWHAESGEMYVKNENGLKSWQKVTSWESCAENALSYQASQLHAQPFNEGKSYFEANF